MCCSVLQCVAVCCSVLQSDEYAVHHHVQLLGQRLCVAVCCSVSQFVAVCCSQLNMLFIIMFSFMTNVCVLQCVAVCCSVLQSVEYAVHHHVQLHSQRVYVAVCCSVLQQVLQSAEMPSFTFMANVCVLQCVAKCCSQRKMLLTISSRSPNCQVSFSKEPHSNRVLILKRHSHRCFLAYIEPYMSVPRK